VKAWLRSIKSDERLPGLCVMRVQREKISKDERGFSERVVDRFGRDPSRLQILFVNDADKFSG